MSIILVVDDMPIFREPVAASLQLAGYEVITAGNGIEAMEKLSLRPDLILLDIAMPQMDGLSFLRQLRKDPATRDLPVILLSAVSDKAVVAEAVRIGVQGYLLKSRFSLKELLTRVEKCVGPAGEPDQKPAAQAPSSAAAAPSAALRVLAAATYGATQAAKTAPSAPPGHAPPDAGGASEKHRSSESPQVITAQVQIPQLLTREQCEHRAKTALQAKTLSGIVREVIAEAASPRSEMTQIALIISRDPMLSARVLQAANSVAYATGSGMVTNMADAVRNIGCAKIRDIATTFGIFDAMPESSADGFNPIRSWQHTFAAAILCERLAAIGDQTNAGTAYLVGLCHDLGEILFHTHFGSEYRQVLELESRLGKPREELERTMLGTTHGELAMLTLQCIGLPESILRPIEAYHASISDHRDDPGERLARVLALAELAANGMLLASSGHATIKPITRTQSRAAVGQDQPARPDSASIRSEVFSLSGFLARLPDREESKLMTALYPCRKVRVLLVRAPVFSSYDPVEAALESLAKVTVVNRLPAKKADIAEYGALVVMSPSSSTPGMTGADIGRTMAMRDAGPLPVSWLVGRADAAAAPSEPQPTVWPISIAHLAEFVAGADVQQHPQASGELSIESEAA